MAQVRVEKDVVVVVPGYELGSGREARRDVDLREPDQPGFVVVNAPQHGSEVRIDDLREALDQAEAEFAR